MDLVKNRRKILVFMMWPVMALLLVAPLSQALAADYVAQAEKWFAGITTMKADFVQVASDGGIAEGELHLRRPHRMKIIYDTEEPLNLFTTPVWLHVDRPNERMLTSYPISETPLSLILQETVKMRSDEFTTTSALKDGIISIVMKKKTGKAAGVLTLEFTQKPFVLRRWTVLDAADVSTTVTLHNMRFNHKYENAFFTQPNYIN